jgi:hypothetical protein
MPCAHCGGRIAISWGEPSCVNCGRSPFDAPRVAAPIAKERSVGRWPRRSGITDDDLAAMRETLAGAPKGSKTVIAREIADRLGVSTGYVLQLAGGTKG